MSLKEHLSKFPSMDDEQYWEKPKVKLPIIDGMKPDKAFRAVRYSADCFAWSQEHEKLFKAKVSQIQADIDSKEYEESEDEWEDKIWLEGYLEAKEEDKALLVSPSTPTPTEAAEK